MQSKCWFQAWLICLKWKSEFGKSCKLVSRIKTLFIVYYVLLRLFCIFISFLLCRTDEMKYLFQPPLAAPQPYGCCFASWRARVHLEVVQKHNCAGSFCNFLPLASQTHYCASHPNHNHMGPSAALEFSHWQKKKALTVQWLDHRALAAAVIPCHEWASSYEHLPHQPAPVLSSLLNLNTCWVFYFFLSPEKPLTLDSLSFMCRSCSSHLYDALLNHLCSKICFSSLFTTSITHFSIQSFRRCCQNWAYLKC